MKKLNYEIKIDAPRENVWNTMMDKDVYNDWAKAFSPDSTYEGEWKEGGEMIFYDPNNLGGTKVIFDEFRPTEKTIARHIAMVGPDMKEVEEYNDTMKKWIGTIEEYTFVDNGDDTTTLSVEMNTDEAFQQMFDDSWPKALELLKGVCESRV